MSDKKLSDAATIVELIDIGRDNNYNIKDCSTLIQIGDDVLTVGGLVFDKYIDFIKAVCITVNFTGEEVIKYKYNPKKLSFDLYKTEELWYMILKLNNMASEIDFIPTKLFILHPSNIDVLNKILLLNEDIIDDNHSDIISSSS